MKEMYPEDPNQQNPYGFIMNPQPAPKRGFRLPGIKDPFIARLVVILAGVAIVVVVVGVLISNFMGRGSVDIPALTGVVQAQQEIVRVSQQGVSQGTQSTVRNFAITVQLSVRTNQLQMLDYLQTQKTKVGTKTLNLKKSATTDTALKTALQTSTFDSTFAQQMQNILVAYTSELEQVSSGATGNKEKKLLAQELATANALLQQVPTQESLQNGS